MSCIRFGAHRRQCEPAWTPTEKSSLFRTLGGRGGGGVWPCSCLFKKTTGTHIKKVLVSSYMLAVRASCPQEYCCCSNAVLRTSSIMAKWCVAVLHVTHMHETTLTSLFYNVDCQVSRRSVSWPLLLEIGSLWQGCAVKLIFRETSVPGAQHTAERELVCIIHLVYRQAKRADRPLLEKYAPFCRLACCL